LQVPQIRIRGSIAADRVPDEYVRREVNSVAALHLLGAGDILPTDIGLLYLRENAE
jgi:hypothetical protein